MLFDSAYLSEASDRSACSAYCFGETIHAGGRLIMLSIMCSERSPVPFVGAMTPGSPPMDAEGLLTVTCFELRTEPH